MPVVAKGLEGIVANSTAISDVRGDIGQLIYAGYDINELAGKASFELPTQTQLDSLTEKLRAQRELPQGVIDFLKTAPKDASPMDVIRTGVSLLGLYDSEDGPEANYHRAINITAKIGVIAAYFHRLRQGKDLPPVRQDLSEAATSSTAQSPPRRPRKPSTSPTCSTPTTA